jgi:hypothetical protein
MDGRQPSDEQDSEQACVNTYPSNAPAVDGAPDLADLLLVTDCLKNATAGRADLRQGRDQAATTEDNGPHDNVLARSPTGSGVLRPG